MVIKRYPMRVIRRYQRGIYPLGYLQTFLKIQKISKNLQDFQRKYKISNYVVFVFFSLHKSSMFMEFESNFNSNIDCNDINIGLVNTHGNKLLEIQLSRGED
jgi:hypothetical protein